MEGRYLLGVEPAAKSVAFLEQLAGISLAPDALEVQGRHANALRAQHAGRVPGPPVVACPDAFAEHLAKVRARPLFQQLFGGGDAEFGMVDLAQVIPLQPHVDFSFARSRIGGECGADALLALCLPAVPEPLDVWGGVNGSDGTGAFTVCGRDLNLIVSEVKMETEPQLRVAFTITKTAVFAVVVEVDGRFYMRDGTHRAVGALASGVERLPCVIAHERTVDALPRHLPLATLQAEHPPLLLDFCTAELHFPHPWHRGLKVIRIRADEFVIPDQGGTPGAPPDVPSR